MTAASVPLVSIVIPCYNQAHFLSDALESCLAQSHSACEIIVIDDGSTDDTAGVSRRFPAARYVYQRNRGLAAARNVGLSASRAEYVAFLDADDRLKPHAVETNLQWLVDRPELAMVSGDHCYIDREGHVVQEWTRPPVTQRHYQRLLEGNYIGNCASALFRRAVIDAIGGFDTTLVACEDYDLYLRVARQYPVNSHEVTLSEYRRYGSAMSDDPARMLAAAIGVLRRQRRFVRGDAGLALSYEIGLEYWQTYYGRPLAEQLAAGDRRVTRTWVTRLWTLLRYAPRESRGLVRGAIR